LLKKYYPTFQKKLKSKLELEVIKKIHRRKKQRVEIIFAKPVGLDLAETKGKP
jgi:hypothetical protein